MPQLAAFEVTANKAAFTVKTDAASTALEHAVSPLAFPAPAFAGFTDADEYIILRPDIPSLPALLQRYEQFGGLALFSKPFGTSGHKTRPAVGTRRGFTKCAPTMEVCCRVMLQSCQ